MDLEEFDCTGKPGFAAGRYEAGLLVESHCSGLASVEFEVPITPSTRMNLGSVAKQFTAWAVALLEDAGELGLEDLVTRHLPVPETGATLLDLINHTNAFVDYPHWNYLAGTALHSGKRAVAAAVNAGALTAPNRGSGFLYSNTGYNMLAEVVRRVSGRSLGTFAREAIFEPLGMQDSLIREDMGAVVARRAHAYDVGGTRVFDVGESEEPIGPGGVYTTLNDWALWEANARSNQLGQDPARLAARLTGPDVPNPGSRYHGGLRRTRIGDVLQESHLGAYLSYSAFMMRCGDTSLLVMGNGPDASAPEIGTHLAAGLLPRPVAAGWKPAPGLYRNAETGTLRQIGVDGIDEGSGAQPVVSLGETAWYEAGGVLFFQDATGLREVCLGPSYDLVFDPLVELDEHTDLAAYVGIYYAQRLDRSLEVDADADGLTLRLGGEHRRMLPIAQDLFDIGARMSAEVIRQAGEVTALRIGTPRVPLVDFHRVS